MRHYELLYNGHLHTEKLSHEIFVVLTGLIIGSWTISNQYLHLWIQRISLDILSIMLAVGGLLLLHRLQGSVEEVHLIMNRIRGKLRHDEQTYKGKSIFPKEWKEYLEENEDSCLKSPKRVPATGRYRWWTVYKFLYIVMAMIGAILAVTHLPGN